MVPRSHLPSNTFSMNIFNSRDKDTDEKMLGMLGELLRSREELSQQMRLLESRMIALDKAVGQMGQRLDAILKRRQTAQSSQSVTAVADRQSEKSRQDSKPTQNAEKKPEPPKVRTIYAVMVGPDKLSPVDDSRKDQAQFVIEARGTTGKARFNPGSAMFCLANPESKLLPYFDCDMTSSAPSAIKALNEANATQTGQFWNLDRTIRLQIY